MPHSIAVDASGHVYVADRGNRRMQVFDGDGTFLRQFTIDVPVDPNARPAIGNKPISSRGTMAPGSPWAICITPGPHQVMYVSDGFPGRVTLVPAQTILSLTSYSLGMVPLFRQSSRIGSSP